MSDYCTAEDVKTRLGISGSGDDVLIEKIVTAASRAIDKYCERVFTSTSTTKYFDSDGGAILMLDEDLLSDPEPSIINDDETLDSVDYILYPLNKDPKRWIEMDEDKGKVWVKGRKKVAITGSWGYCEVADIPKDIWNAAVELSCRIFKMKDTAYGDATANVELGQLVYQKAIPHNIRLVLDQYRAKLGFISV